MRALLACLGIAAALGVGWLVLGGDADRAPPSVAPPEADPGPAPVDPLTVGRSPVPERRLPEAADGNPTGEPAATVPAPSATTPSTDSAPGRGRIRLRVFDAATGAPVDGVRTTRTVERSGIPVSFRPTEPEHGGVDGFDVDLEEPVDLLIEAEGYVPERRTGVVATAASPELVLDIYLAPKPPFSGIEITARDDQGAAVQHLQVTAWRTPDAGTPPLWSRQARNDFGIYELPDLQPGVYRLELAPVDENGKRRPLLSHTEDVTFGGSERIPVHVRFRTGALLTVSVVDPAGRPRGAEVVLRLEFPDGSAPSLRWHSEVEGEILERRDGLPAAAPALTAEPLPPGTYTLRLQLASGAEQAVRVQLLPGARERVTVTL